MWVEVLTGFGRERGPAVSAAGCTRALRHRPGCVWLDGDGSFGEAGRFSFVGSDPVEVREVRFGDGRLAGAFSELGDDAGSERAAALPRWIGYIAYDATFLGLARRPPRLPRAADETVIWLGRYDALAVFDHVSGETQLVGDDRDACLRLRERLDAGARAEPDLHATVGQPVVRPPREHEASVRTVLERIASGDVYQVNLARRWEASFDGEPLALWIAMRDASSVPLGVYLDTGDHAVLARTMETFLRWDHDSGVLLSRPIKGTVARRGRDGDEARRLVADDKERAEHSMIVDLVRNDLSRVARPGTVTVDGVMTVEPYAKLHHLVSTVRCQTAPATSLADVLHATFPPGSVTGAPKLAAIEIIEALEPVPRGVYTGAVGYVDRAGGAHFAVAIRTAQIRGGSVHYHAGGGLVSASDPAREVAETELKARVFLDAVEALRAPTG